MLTSLQQSLALQLLPHTAAGTYWRLHEAFGHTEAIFQQPVSNLASLLKPEALSLFSEFRHKGRLSQLYQYVDNEQQLAEHHRVQLIHFDDARYPNLLKHIRKPPPLLYVRGNTDLLNCPQIAMVGSRKPSATGRNTAKNFARGLADSGYVITSGLALGIDACAHLGALDAGLGNKKTIAVLGSGLARIYPSRHRQLAMDIVENGGAVISEFPMSTAALPANFPQRNRIVSGLSKAVLVVEAALKSGSLITARFALEQDREVFAVPGSICNPMAAGCHALIKQGAMLVEQPEDLIQELSGFVAFQQQHRDVSQPQQPEPIDEKTQKVLDVMGYEVTDLATIAERCQYGFSELTEALLALELKGLIENTGLGYSRV